MIRTSSFVRTAVGGAFGAVGTAALLAGAAPGVAIGADLPGTRVSCSSGPGGPQTHCTADTSAGVVLLSSTGGAACLLGRTWGYTATAVWVSDGCAGEFLVTGAAAASAAAPAATGPAAAGAAPAATAGGAGAAPAASSSEAPAVATTSESSPEYIPNLGFKIYEGDKGQIYMRLFSYARYLNQKGLDETYTNYFGKTSTLQLREDVQLNKFFLPFAGWFLTPKLRYYLYVWSSNPSQGDPAQVVGAGNLSYVFNRYVTFGAGITSLPGVRSTEGQFPFWLTVDNRLIADEFFRPSYTSGVWLKGQLAAGVNYMAMLGNNLSTLGVSASQLDNKLDTYSLSVNWLPTTHEFGPLGAFGDFEGHEQLATRLGAHFTHSTEDRQAQPGTETIENSQIRLTDGSVIFTRNLFGPGISVDRVRYEMASLDAGLKYRGFSLEGEYYWRWLSNFEGPGTASIADIDDQGWQLQASMMAIPSVLQPYVGFSRIEGKYGNGSEKRLGINWFPQKTRGFRLNAEWIRLEDSPVGYSAVPYIVGANGDVFHANFEVNF